VTDEIIQVLKFDPDYAAVEKALDAIQKKTEAGIKAGTLTGGAAEKALGQIGVYQSQLEHAQKLAQIRVDSDPAVISSKVRQQREVDKALKTLAGAEGWERWRQGGFLGSGVGGTAGAVLATGVTEAGKGIGQIGGMLRYAGANAGGVAGNVAGAAGSLLTGDLFGTAGHLFGAVSEGLKAVGTAAGAVVTGPFRALSSGLAELGGQLGPIGVGFNVLSGTLQTVSSVVKAIPILGSLLGPFTDAVAALPGIFKDITTTLVGFAAKASPGLFQTWTMALEDVQGVIGQTFLPVLEMMREGVRLFGDVLANILPSSGEARDALAEFRGAFAEMAATIRDTIRQAGPSIRQWFVAGLRELSHWLAVAARGVGILAERLRAYFGTAGMLQGGAQFRSSVGAAAREAQFSGFGEYEKALQLAAYKQPGGTVEEQVLAQMTDMVRLENDANALIKGLDDTWKWLQGAWESFRTWMEKAWIDVVAITNELKKIVALLAARSGHDWLEEANAGILAGVGGRVFRAGQKKE
jgi:hypothetical protein